MEETQRGGLPLHVQMLIGFLIGLLGGLWVHLGVGPETPWVQWLTSNVTGPIGQIFMRLLFMLVLLSRRWWSLGLSVWRVGLGLLRVPRLSSSCI